MHSAKSEVNGCCLTARPYKHFLDSDHGEREPDHRSRREVKRILEEMKAVQEKIQKDVAHLTGLKMEIEETFKKTQEEQQNLEVDRNSRSQPYNPDESTDICGKGSKQ
ncbi:hypothetical protein BsWGS_17734 [Bradybaena similaris]